MHLSRIEITNFRNFASLDVSLDQHAVIVGENKIGKSNLVHALRLILDPTLPDAQRYLRQEDFWDGLQRPLTKDDAIEVSVEFSDFADDDELLALLAQHIVCADPMTSRLTYRYQPLETLHQPPTSESDYEFELFGGGRPDNQLAHELRRRIPLDLFEALRDAETDLERWRRSPLRPLLEKVAADIDQGELTSIANAVRAATETLTQQDEVQALAESLNERIEEMVGKAQSLNLTIGFAPTSPERLIRSLRLFIDAGTRSVSDASLGSANVLYLALRTLERRLLVDEGRRNFSVVAIEEPEAHLHPQLQRLVYRDFLSPPDGNDDVLQRDSIFLTTHSPHIVSVTPLSAIVVLKLSDDLRSTVGHSCAELAMDDRDREDIERYLDVTRSEIVFARGVILVEGVTEQYLLPALARLVGSDLDELGISVCAVGGANFAPYAKFLGPEGISTPFCVLTDLDRLPNGQKLGLARTRALLRDVFGVDPTRTKTEQDCLKAAAQNGIFLNGSTLEVELWNSGAREPMCRTLTELAEGKAMRERAENYQGQGDDADMDDLMSDIARIGKGRFAQRLSTYVLAEHCPAYMRDSIDYLKA